MRLKVSWEAHLIEGVNAGALQLLLTKMKSENSGKMNSFTNLLFIYHRHLQSGYYFSFIHQVQCSGRGVDNVNHSGQAMTPFTFLN